MNSPVLAYKSRKMMVCLGITVIFMCISACTVMANCVDSENYLTNTNKGENTDVKKPHTQRCEVNLRKLSVGSSPGETVSSNKE